jgi:hypothetical protein
MLEFPVKIFRLSNEAAFLAGIEFFQEEQNVAACHGSKILQAMGNKDSVGRSTY